MSTPAVNKAGCGHGGPRRARRGAHRGSITWKGCCKWQLLLVLLLLPPAHSTTTEGGYTEAHAKYRGLHVYRWPHNIYRELRVNMQIAPNSFPVSAANTAFLGTTSLAQQGKGPQKSTSNIMKNFSLAREVWAYPCSVTTLWGSRSNRINGKKPSVLPSPSPFPAALLHLLPGGSSLPNEVYIGQHVRLPVSPSSNLSLSRGPQGPPRLFAPAPLLLDIRASLQKQGLPVTRLRWPQDAALQQQQEQQKQEQKQEGVRAQNGEPLTFESLAVKGDKHPEKKMFGAEAPLFKHHLHFGAPPWPNAIIAMAKEYNRQAREAGKEADTVPTLRILQDTIFCDDRGRVLRMRENAPPYGGEEEPESGPTTWELLRLRREREKESPPHRFIVTAPAGYVAKAGITVGMQLPMLNDEQLATVYNNHFAQPKKFREPLILPDGTCIP